LETLITVAILVFLSLVLLATEMIIPSFGTITLLAIILTSVASYKAFQISTTYGYATIITAVVLAPVALWIGSKILPYTPFYLGTKIEGHAKRTGLEKLVGQQGTVVTQLHPCGRVRIRGKLYDAKSEQVVVAAGTTVEVIYVESGELLVKPTDHVQIKRNGRGAKPC
jgi:membrane-bound serine protease (ClpP class)